MTSRSGLPRLALGAGLLGGSWLALRSAAVQRADVRVGDLLRQFSVPVLDQVVTATTDLGSMYSALGSAAVLRALGRTDAAADALGLGAAAWVLAQTNKRFVRRQRPYEAHGARRLIRPPTGSSFPSGHAALGMAVMVGAADRARGPLAAALLRGIGVYVGASRVYVGVHYPSDVLGGAGLGLLLAGAWRGPIGVVGRGGVSRTARTARGLAPALLRLAAVAAAVRAWSRTAKPIGPPGPPSGVDPPGPPGGVASLPII